MNNIKQLIMVNKQNIDGIQLGYMSPCMHVVDIHVRLRKYHIFRHGFVAV